MLLLDGFCCLFCGKQRLLGLGEAVRKEELCQVEKGHVCFSADERQIRGGKTYASIRTMEQQVKTCKGEGEHSANGRVTGKMKSSY